MATVDDKVVAMSFESSKFESGVNSAITALDKLKKALTIQNAGKGLDDIGAAGKKVDLSHIGSALDKIKSKFSTLAIVGLQVLGDLASKAVTAGAKLIKAITIDPIIQGYHEYETQLNAVQTILSNTSAAGVKLKDVNKALNELNTYADKTIYNFSEMTKNIGTFTAAGVDLKTSVSSIKGIANLAALSGSNSQQASTAMYQLSQAISSGTVKLQDWNSVVNAGMGGTVFQRALAQTAEHMGTLDKGAVKLTGSMKNVSIHGHSFRESLQAKPGETSWLTSKVLTTTLKQLSGDMSDAELKAKGYSKAQIKAIQDQAKMALNAATQVKTLSQLLDTTKEAVGSGWAQTWQIIFGDFGEAKTLFTALSNSINGFVSASATARNKVLGDWKALGGRTVLIDGLKSAFNDLMAVVKPIKDAFRDIFPPTTGKQLYDLTVKFKTFMDAIKPSPDTVNNLHRTFAGLFALLDIGKQVVTGIFSVFGKLFSTLTTGSGGFLEFTGNIGDFIVKVDEAIKSGGGLKDFFTTLGTVLATPIQFLVKIRDAIFEIFNSKISGGVSDAVGGLSDKLSPFQTVVEGVRKAWNKFVQGLGKSSKILKPAAQAIGNIFSGLGDFISKSLENINWDSLLATIRTGLLGGLVLMMKKFFSGGSLTDLAGGGILSSIGGSFEALTGALTALQTNIKANTLLQIAAAVGILAAAILTLSTIDPKKLDSAMAGITIAFGELIGAFALLNQISSGTGFLKIPLIAGGMILLAGAVDLLAIAVKKLSALNWSELTKGLVGVGVLLASISAASGPLSKNAPGMISAGVGMTAIAIALKILASAVKDFGGMSWSTLGKGLGTIAIAIGGIGLASKLFPSGMMQIGAGLIAVALGVKLLAGAVNQFGSMKWGEIAKGLIGVAGAMLVIAGAMRLMPTGMAVQAAGLVLVALAIKSLGESIASFGGMSITAIAKGLGTLAGALLILAVALNAMSGSLAGSAALAVAAAGLSLLAPALVSLGKQSVGQIVKGLISLAAAIAILGAASILLEPAVPAMLGMGAALVLIGGGLALAGAGIALVGVGLSAIAVAGPTAIGILLKAFTDFMEQIPKFVSMVVSTLVNLVTQIGAAAPKFVVALGQILTALANAVILAVPAIEKAFNALIDAALRVLVRNIPNIVDAGMKLLIGLIKGIRDNVDKLVTMIVSLITTILTTIGNNLNKITAAGGKLLAKFIEGILDNINTVVNMVGTIISKFLNTIANNLYKIINAGANVLKKFLQGIGDNIGDIIDKAVAVVTKFINGIANNIDRIVTSGKNLIVKFIDSVSRNSVDLFDKGAEAVIKFINGVADGVRRHSKDLGDAGGNLASALVEGMITGLGSLAGTFVSKVKDMAKNAVNAGLKALHIKSPSKDFIYMGEMIVQGLIVGVDSNADDAVTSVENMANSMIGAIPDAFAGIADIQPTITPVLDLTQVQADAETMKNMLNVVPITAAASYGQASAISTDQTVQAAETAAVGPNATSVKFEQNNYSPESLSPTEIYRQTKNQLAQAAVLLA